jgi:hypothetical protein
LISKIFHRISLLGCDLTGDGRTRSFSAGNITLDLSAVGSESRLPKTDEGYEMLPLPRPTIGDLSEAYRPGTAYTSKNKKNEATIYSSELNYEETIAIDDIMNV